MNLESFTQNLLPQDRPIQGSYVLVRVVSIVAGLAICGLLSWDLWQSRQTELRLADVTMQYQSRVLGERIGAQLSEFERELRAIASDRVVEQLLQSNPNDRARKGIKRTTFSEGGVIEYRYFNFDGIEMFVEQGGASDIFDKHKNQFLDFVIEAPVQERPNGPWHLSMSRSVYSLTGDFVGIVQQLVDLSDFQKLIADEEDGGFELAVMFNANGNTLTFWPPRKELHNGYIGQPVEKVLPIGDTLGPLELVDNSFDVKHAEQVVSIYKVSHFPIYTGLSKTYQTILAPWQAKSIKTSWAMFFVVLSVLLINLFAVRRMRHEVAQDLAIRRLHTAVEQSPVSVMMTDLLGNIVYVNPAFSVTTGYSPEEVMGQNPRILKSGHTSDQEYKALWQTITNGRRWRGEFLNRKKNGEVVWESASISPIRSSNGEISNFLAVKEDITARKSFEETLQSAKEEAERANSAKSEFLAAMSHDLRTPLNAIMGFSDMMRTKAFGPLGSAHYEEYVDDIYNSGSLLVSLINDVLDLSKIEAGKYEFFDQELILPNLIDTCTKQLMPMASASNHKLTAHVPDNMPRLWGDERAMTQILNNLLSNAIKFTPEKGVISVKAFMDDKCRINIAVQDNGIGMSEDGIAKALLPFEQVDGALSRRHKGTGLGLHLCLNFMKLFGGDLKIESQVDVGTTMTLVFPENRTCNIA